MFGPTDAAAAEAVLINEGFESSASIDLNLVAGNNAQRNLLYLNDGTGAFGAGTDMTYRRLPGSCR